MTVDMAAVRRAATRWAARTPCRVEADDIAQETAIRLWRTGRHGPALVNRCVKLAALDLSRRDLKRARRKLEIGPFLDGFDPAATVDVEAEVVTGALARRLSTDPTAARVLAGMTRGDIAKADGVTVSAVTHRLHGTRQEIARWLAA